MHYGGHREYDTQIANEPAASQSATKTTETKLEVVVIPVSDVDRAKRFYQSLGWRLDADFSAGDEWRGVQLTPPGSPCSIIFGKGFTSAVPGSVQGTFLVVDDVEAARAGTLTDLLREAEEHHGAYEATAPKHHCRSGTPPTSSRVSAGRHPRRRPRMRGSI